MSKISAAALLQLADQFDRQKKCLDLWEKITLAIGEGSLLPGKLTCPLKINGWKIVPF